MASAKFSPATGAYFDGAAAHENDRTWFDAHRTEYEEHVAAPLIHLVRRMSETLSAQLPDIEFSPKKIVRPVRRQLAGSHPLAGRGNGPAFLAPPPVVRSNATAFFSVPAMSRFEMNPGFYVSLGAKANDNVYGAGLYLPSSRQMKLLRAGIVDDAEALDGCLQTPAVRRRWGSLSGRRYQRFPKGFDEGAPGAGYLWHKQFFLGREFSRVQMGKPGFVEAVAGDFALALPFLQWVKDTVGIYRKPGGV